MGHSNGKIFAPVSLEADIFAVLNIPVNGATSAQDAFISDNINYASRIKPIRGYGFEALTTAQFAGTAADNNQGIFYGLKVGDVFGYIKNLHDCTFEYQKVRPGTDWLRGTDFDGYDHNAVMNPQGTLPDIAYYDKVGANALSIDINYSTSNTTGVDINDIIAVGNASVTATLGQSYPCILVSDIQRTKNWARALKRVSGNDYAQMQVSGAWQRGWYAEINDYTHSGDQSPESFFKSELTRLVTVFFINEINSQALGIDLRKWVDVTSLVVGLQGFACPSASGKQIPFKRSASKGIMLNFLMLSGNKGTVSWKWVDPDATVTYKYTITIFNPNGSVLTSASGTRKWDGQPLTQLTSTFNQSITLPIVGSLPSGNYRYQWSVVNNAIPTQLYNQGEGTYTVS